MGDHRDYEILPADVGQETLFQVNRTSREEIGSIYTCGSPNVMCSYTQYVYMQQLTVIAM